MRLKNVGYCSESSKKVGDGGRTPNVTPTPGSADLRDGVGRRAIAIAFEMETGTDSGKVCSPAKLLQWAHGLILLHAKSFPTKLSNDVWPC